MKKNLQIKSFRIKLISATMLFIIGGIALSIWISTILFIRNIEANNEKQASLAYAEAEANILQLLTEASKTAGSVHSLDAVCEYLLSNQSDNRTNTLAKISITDALKDILKSSPVSSIFFCGSNGRMVGFTAKNRYFSDSGDYPFYESLQSLNLDNSYLVQWTDSVDLSLFIPSSIPAQFIKNCQMVGGLRQYTYYEYSSNRTLPVTMFFEINPHMLMQCFSYLGNDGSDIYLINSNGEIISSNTSRNGILDCCIDIDLSVSSNYHFTDSENQSYQIITFPLTVADWTLVKSVPRQLFTSSVHTIWKSTLVAGAVILVAMVVLYSIWVQRFTRPINRLVDAIHRAQEGNLNTRASTEQCNSTEMLVVTKAFNSMLDSIGQLMKQKEINERELMSLEIKTLQAQITPHFIYNTLTAIRFMAIGNSDENVAKALLIFSNNIHPIFSSWQRDWLLIDEYDFTKNYIDLMRMRFGNKISIRTAMDERIQNCRIPRFTLQTLLENCCEHGTNNDRVLHIQLSAELINDKIHISVRDDGLGIPEEKLFELHKMMNGEIEPKSIGLVNLNKRLHLYFFDDCDIKIENTIEGGAIVTICMPQLF